MARIVETDRNTRDSDRSNSLTAMKMQRADYDLPLRTRSFRVSRIVKAAWPWQLLVLILILAGWQWIPSISGASKVSPVFDPFFISSPERVGRMLYRLATGAHATPTIWAPLKFSLVPAISGTAAAVVVGSVSGLICSNWSLLDRIVRPFLIVFNAIPRITLIPVILVIGGPTATSDVIIGFIIVFFLVFFNAYEGGKSVSREVLSNARILGAGHRDQLRMIRGPYVLAWTFMQLPNAIAFGVTAIVTAELFTGANGMGRLLLIATQTANADLTFAVTIYLAVSALLLIGLASYARKRVLHWW